MFYEFSWVTIGILIDDREKCEWKAKTEIDNDSEEGC